MEPFFRCMKESKGLPLQTKASGSGDSVVAAVTGTVVVSAAAAVLGASVVPEVGPVGGTASVIGVTCTPGMFCSLVSIG